MSTPDGLVGLTVEPGAATPPYEQIKAFVREGARAGSLLAGTRLPPVRRLADHLGVATNTVARAYRELEAEGVLVTRGRHGTHIAESAAGSLEAASAGLRAAADAYLAAADRAGASSGVALAEVSRALELQASARGEAPPRYLPAPAGAAVPAPVSPSTPGIYIELHVPQFAPVLDFYGALGFEVAWINDAPDHTGYLVMGMGSAVLCFWPGNEAPETQEYFGPFPDGHRGLGVEIVLPVDDLDGVYARATAVGAVLDPLQVRASGLRDFRAADPFGYYLRFSDRHDPAAAPKQ